MAFYSRPDLSDVQFKQYVGSELTLSGQTKIASVTGFTLTDGIGNDIILTASGASTVGQVLTFDGSKIKLMPSAVSGDTLYLPPYKSPASITLGGISSGTVLTGRTISSIIEGLLVPTMNPALSSPSSIFTISPITTTYEVGKIISLTGTSIFSRGSIAPQYSSASPYRSGLPIAHIFSPFGLTAVSANTTNLSTGVTFSHIIQANNNIISGSVLYSAGVQPKNSSGGTYSTPLSSGMTTVVPRTICGIYPYYYGKISKACAAGVCRPAATVALITGGTCVVSGSTGTICINFNSTANDYIFFATPSASTIKTKWYVNSFNCGSIGGGVSSGCNLFPNHSVEAGVASSLSCWNGQTYNVYISNYQTALNTIIELRNS